MRALIERSTGFTITSALILCHQKYTQNHKPLTRKQKKITQKVQHYGEKMCNQFCLRIWRGYPILTRDLTSTQTHIVISYRITKLPAHIGFKHATMHTIPMIYCLIWKLVIAAKHYGNMMIHLMFNCALVITLLMTSHLPWIRDAYFYQIPTKSKLTGKSGMLVSSWERFSSTWFFFFGHYIVRFFPFFTYFIFIYYLFFNAKQRLFG